MAEAGSSSDAAPTAAPPRNPHEIPEDFDWESVTVRPPMVKKIANLMEETAVALALSAETHPGHKEMLDKLLEKGLWDPVAMGNPGEGPDSGVKP